MPILGVEPSRHPENLFDEPRPAEAGADRRWSVLHTRPRQEKSLVRQLLGKRGIPFYLPLITKRRRSRGRTLSSYVPLFPGYVFLLGNRDERLTALTTNRVVHALEVVDQEKLWFDLRQIHLLIASGAPITPEQRLAPGMIVEITNGPLTGLKGKIIRTASGRRFVVQVDFIQQGASVVLDDFAIQGVSE